MSSSPATTPSLSASAPRPAARPLPWAVVIGFALLVLGGLVFFTLYLPARQAADAGNVVSVGDLTIQLSAEPDPSREYGVELNVVVEPAPDASAVVEVAPTMPGMGRMRALVRPVVPAGNGAYRAAADLGMGGLWQVLVTIHRPGRPDVAARFRLNA